MTCLQKAFEGENLPALVNKIMTVCIFFPLLHYFSFLINFILFRLRFQCSYAPIRGPYSTEIKVLVRELLQLEPEARPRAADALKVRFLLLGVDGGATK